jgi:hypothetical protein
MALDDAEWWPLKWTPDNHGALVTRLELNGERVYAWDDGPDRTRNPGFEKRYSVYRQGSDAVMFDNLADVRCYLIELHKKPPEVTDGT